MPEPVWTLWRMIVMYCRYILYRIFIYLIHCRVINLKRVRQPKQTYGMKAHVVQLVEGDLLHIHGDFSLSGAHGRGVRCSRTGSSVAPIIVTIGLFLSTQLGASLSCIRRRRPSYMTGTWTAGKGCSFGFRV